MIILIDYNAGEIIFTPLFPITSEMRINVEYQFTDRNFTRFVTYGGVMHEQEKFKIGGYIYSENDVKNQPLQQNLSEEQVAILQDAGDNPNLMTAPSAYLDSYSENKILYRKTIIGTTEVFEYSNDSNDELYNVRFSFVGANQGSYILKSSDAIGKIYEYAGALLGDYEPTIPLIAPTKIQIATILGSYTPSEKTNIDFEVAVSNNDKNLYSTINDNDNKGIAGKLNTKQRIYTGKFNVDGFANFQLVQKDFRTIERLYNIEFNRDWNLNSPLGNQSLLVSGANFNFLKNGFAKYQLEKLDFSENFSGTRHIIQSVFKIQQNTFQTDFSALNSKSDYANSKFLRNQSRIKQHFAQNGLAAVFDMKTMKNINSTNELSNLTQRFSEFGAFVGRGDSTKVYVELGYLNRVNDSLQNGVLSRVNKSIVLFKIAINQKRNHQFECFCKLSKFKIR